MTAQIESPPARAWDKRFRTTTPQPSPRTYPSASAENVLQRPSGASIRALDKVIDASGERIRLTPPARAMSHSRWRKLCTARCTATREEEQAVSIAMLGPRKSSKYDSRFATMLFATPEPA